MGLYSIGKLLTVFGLLGIAGSTSDVSKRNRMCEPIKIDICSDIGYNMTGMPNFAGHKIQGDAKYELETYTLLIQSRCSNEIQFFLCSVYVPMCVPEISRLIGPCRPLCERVQQSCTPTLKEFGFPWPEALNCSKFPTENRSPQMCMEGPGKEHTPPDLPPNSFNTLQKNPHLMEKLKDHLNDKNNGFDKFNEYKEYFRLLDRNLNRQKPAQGFSTHCREMKKSSNYQYIERLDECIPKCKSDISFTSDEKEAAEIWMSVLASLCLASTILTLTTFFLDLNRFVYPRRSAVFMSFSYFCYSITFVIRLLLHREDISCQRSGADSSILLLTREGMNNPTCVIVFILYYFFANTANAWCTVLTFTFCLISIWPEKITANILASYSSVYHVFAWGVPALQTVIAMVLLKIDAEELTGLCTVGAQNDESLLLFILIPETVQFILATSFWVVGVFQCKNKSTQVKKLNARISFFFLFYVIAKLCVIGSYYYEYFLRSAWLSASKPDVFPNGDIFTLRLLMSLGIGIASLLWVWSRTSLAAWRKLAESCFGFWSRDKKRRAPTPDFPTVAYKPQATNECQIQLPNQHHPKTSREQIVVGSSQPNTLSRRELYQHNQQHQQVPYMSQPYNRVVL